MKTLPLLASLAVTTAVSAADLKDPATVARNWNQAVGKASEPAAPPQSLMEQSDALTTTPLERIFSPENQRPARLPKPRWKFDDGARANPPLREPLIDAPNYRIPDVLPDNLPPGAKLWEYNGQKFWLIPLAPGASK